MVGAGVFRCRECGTTITKPLQPLLAPLQTQPEDGEPLIPAGSFQGPIGEEWFTQLAHCTAINLSDAINVKHHKDPRRLAGCCGLDGCDGPNVVCINGHEIGTEKSDCWMPHALLLDPAKVELVQAMG